MSDIKLTARTALGGYARQFDGISIAEVANRAIVSIACPRDGEKALADAVKKSLGCDMPPVGRSVVAKSGIRIAGMQPGQWFALLDFAGDDAVGEIAGKLGDKAYYTDQTDAWAMLSVSGPNCRRALERICMLDLAPGSFPEGASTRTVMEHLGTLIVRDGPDSFLLAAARSSAKSFLHAVETSAQNVG
ncbi:MAG: sarcosine oxidase subunit gamma [Rhodobiaceae bacterium]|nr:sarcosine oxidase subunit gamma [Rhodobiaceae bacterium]